MTNPDAPFDVLDLAKAWMELCGSCDAGMFTGCTCPEGDPRAIIARLAQEVIALRKAVADGRTDALECIAVEVVGVRAADVHPREQLRFGEIRAALAPNGGDAS